MNITITERPSRKLVGFPPVSGKFPQIMILGSMPSVESLRQKQYYGLPRNQFWKILRNLLKSGELNNYEDKKRMLMSNHIALWDVVYSCRREGSLDSNMRDIKTNDFKYLLKTHTTLKAIFCNGQASYQLFRRTNKDIGLPIVVLPSTSPAYTLSFDKKLAQWRKILKFI